MTRTYTAVEMESCLIARTKMAPKIDSFHINAVSSFQEHELIAALSHVPEFKHDQGRREELLGLCFRLSAEVGSDRACKMMSDHSPSVEDIADYFRKEPDRINKGSICYFLREKYQIDLKPIRSSYLSYIGEARHALVAGEQYVRPTEEDLLSQFPLLVEKELLGEDHWISIGKEAYRWVKTHYELVSSANLQRRIVSIARNTTQATKKGGEHHPFAKPRCIDEALSWFYRLTARDPEEINPPGLVNCRNGVVRIHWKDKMPKVSIVEHDPKVHFFIDPPGLVYDPAANTEHAERLLGCLTPGGRKAFLQVAGSTLDIQAIRKLGHRVPAMLLIGQGENGKDTLREAISRIHGSSSVANISINDWQQYETGNARGRFSVAQLDRSRLSIASENSGAFKVDSLEQLKAAITGDRIFIEHKGLPGVNICPRAAFFFFLNTSPLLDGGSSAIVSRWAVAKMPNSYSTKPRIGQLQADPRFKHDSEWLATNVLPAILNYLLDGLEDVARNGFDLDSCSAELQSLREETSHLHSFLQDKGYRFGAITDFVKNKCLWSDLKEWYQANGWMTINQFSQCEWEYVDFNDGDKPIRAERLLPKKLIQLYPSLRKGKDTGKARNVLIYGLSKVRSNSENYGS